MSNKNEKQRSMGEELLDATLVTILTIGAGYVSKKVFDDSLGTPTTFDEWIKFETAITLGFITLNLLRRNKFMPSILNYKGTKN